MVELALFSTCLPWALQSQSLDYCPNLDFQTQILTTQKQMKILQIKICKIFVS